MRTPEEFTKYHIQNAKNINYRNANFKREIEKLDKSKPVLIYCLSGARSKMAMQMMHEAGFVAIYELNVGINGWLKARKPVVEDLSGTGELSSAEYNTIVAGKGFVLVDFYARWCAPCLKILPIVQDLEKTHAGRFKLLTVDFDRNRLLVKEKCIVAVPYLIIFKDGKKIWEKQGEATKEELMTILELPN